RDRGNSHDQLRGSLLMISSGGTTGRGGMGVPPARLTSILPAAYTDFIHAVIGAEWGFLGCLGLIVPYMGLLAASIEIAGSTRDLYGRLLVVGMACMLLCQAAMNLCMTVGLMPVVGVALPFVSYGGSSLLAS